MNGEGAGIFLIWPAISFPMPYLIGGEDWISLDFLGLAVVILDLLTVSSLFRPNAKRWYARAGQIDYPEIFR